MRIAVIGGGPGGLYFAALAKHLAPDDEITGWGRNAADDTFGFGVVISDETRGGSVHAAAQSRAAMQAESARWADIDAHYRGAVTTGGGHGFAAMSRKLLLVLLQRRCADVNIDVRFSTEAPDVESLRQKYELVVACDGVNSQVRKYYAEKFEPSLESRRCRYMWLGT